MSWLFLRGLIALASSDGYCGLTVCMISLPFGMMNEDDFWRSCNRGRLTRDLRDDDPSDSDDEEEDEKE